MSVYQAVALLPVRALLDVGVGGLTLGDFTVTGFSNGVASATPAADYSLVLVEVATLTGAYELRITPPAAGLLCVFLERLGTTYEFVLQVAAESEGLVSIHAAGAEATHTIIVTDGVGAFIDGAIVRVYDEMGLRLVARGISDASGEVEFFLPAGTYQVKISKTGYVFSTTEIVVESEPDVQPGISEVLPSTFSTGDVVAISGRNFGLSDVLVSFGGTTATPTDISPDADLLLVVVPTVAAGSLDVMVGKLDSGAERIWSDPFPAVAT